MILLNMNQHLEVCDAIKQLGILVVPSERLNLWHSRAAMRSVPLLAGSLKHLVDDAGDDEDGDDDDEVK